MNEDRLRYSAANCSIQRTLEIVGEKWTLLVLREAFFGVQRFEDFHSVLGCARNLLSARLKTLVDEGILCREPYRQPGMRPRQEYRLTEKGLDLFPAVVALMQWGDRWTADAAGPAVLVRHRGCGASLNVQLACSAGHRELTAHEARPEPGPGARAA